jgi:hypothetical protein
MNQNRFGVTGNEGFFLDTKVGKSLLIAGGVFSSAVTGWGVVATLEYLTKLSFQ